MIGLQVSLQSLHNTVRTMALRNVVGQDKAISMLQGILRRERLAGSYLFAGEAGIGKKTAAIQFAKAVNCLKVGSNTDGSQLGLLPIPTPKTLPPVGDACDTCESCRRISADSHPDVLLIAAHLISKDVPSGMHGKHVRAYPARKLCANMSSSSIFSRGSPPDARRSMLIKTEIWPCNPTHYLMKTN